MEAVTTYVKKLNNRDHFESILSLLLIMDNSQHLKIYNTLRFITQIIIGHYYYYQLV